MLNTLEVQFNQRIIAAATIGKKPFKVEGKKFTRSLENK